MAHVLAFFQEFEGHFGLEGWGRGLEGWGRGLQGLEGLRLRVGVECAGLFYGGFGGLDCLELFTVVTDGHDGTHLVPRLYLFRTELKLDFRFNRT